MSKSQKSFVREAAIISVSNFIVKIIGVLYKIPLTNILGDGMGIFTAAYSIYAMLFMISTSGLPVAISRTVAASAEKGRKRETKRILKMAVFVFGIVGVVCTLFLFFFAGSIADWSKHQHSELAMKVIAPTLFFICVSSAYRGYFQGLHNMVPTAISQFIEAFLKMALGLGATLWARHRGYPVQIQAAYAILGLTVGTMCSTAFLIFYKKHSKQNDVAEKSRESMRYGKIAKKLAIIALPVTITSSALYLSQFLDTLVIKKVMLETGVAEQTAEALYTAYTALAISVSDLLPSTLVYPIAISILPAVAGALALNRRRRANGYIISSIRISGIIAIPSSICLFVLARPCIALIYGAGWGNPITMPNGSSVMPIDVAAPALRILSVGIFFISLLSTTTAVLQAIGKSAYPMISVGIGVVFLTILEVALTAVKPIGIFGAPIASVICYVISLYLNMRFLQKSQKLRLFPKRLYLKPFVCALVTGGFCFAAYRLLYSVFGSPDGRLASLVILLVTGIGSVLLYAFLMLLVKGITANEVRLLPKGNYLCDLFIRKGWLFDSGTQNDE